MFYLILPRSDWNTARLNRLEYIQPVRQGEGVSLRTQVFPLFETFSITHLLFRGPACWIHREVCLSSTFFRYLKLWLNLAAEERNYLSESIAPPRVGLGASVQVFAHKRRTSRKTRSKEFPHREGGSCWKSFAQECVSFLRRADNPDVSQRTTSGP